ncbi:MAG TPA: hypothetical protein VFA77_12005 [Candidatus Eisenbacteria bacterium]|jgi:hypothetical protein|nr:hypothetical protein [Candidatus Eisenbacteria bacterium]
MPLEDGPPLHRALALESLLNSEHTNNRNAITDLVWVNHTVSVKQIKHPIDVNQTEHSASE